MDEQGEDQRDSAARSGSGRQWTKSLSLQQLQDAMLRKEHTVTAAAKEIGVSYPTVDGWAKKGRVPTAKMWERIASYCDVRLSDEELTQARAAGEKAPKRKARKKTAKKKTAKKKAAKKKAAKKKTAKKKAAKKKTASAASSQA